MIDLYSSATPNGRKISILLEELNVSYNPIFVDLSKKDQFKLGFENISPSNKIPAIVDTENNIKIFESGAILIYLAEKYNNFFPKENYWEILQWLMFQVSQVGPYLGQAHQFLFYNPGKSDFIEQKYTDYTKRIYETLNKQLQNQQYIVKNYSIADIAIWPWIARHERHNIKIINYSNVTRWYNLISKRGAVIKGYNAIGEFDEIPKI